MATINYTDTGMKIQQAISGNDSVRLSGNLCCGNILMARGTYTVSGAATGDQIRIARLPKGAVLIPHMSKVVCEALGTSFSVKVGDSLSDNRYASAVNMATAGTIAIEGGSAGLTPEPLESTDWITATITAVSAPSVGKKANFWIAYIMP